MWQKWQKVVAKKLEKKGHIVFNWLKLCKNIENIYISILEPRNSKFLLINAINLIWQWFFPRSLSILNIPFVFRFSMYYIHFPHIKEGF